MPTSHNELYKLQHYPYNGILFIHKRNEARILATTWLKLENMLNGNIQTQKAIYCMIPFLYEMSKIGKSIDTG